MTTWTNVSKSLAGAVDFIFSDGADFYFSDATDFVFIEGGALTWTSGTKNSASWTSPNKS